MANQTLAQLTAAATKIKDTAASAKAVIDGISARIQAAVEAAIQNGATEDEVAPVQEEVDALKASADSLSAAVAAKT